MEKAWPSSTNVPARQRWRRNSAGPYCMPGAFATRMSSNQKSMRQDCGIQTRFRTIHGRPVETTLWVEPAPSHEPRSTKLFSNRCRWHHWPSQMGLFDRWLCPCATDDLSNRRFWCRGIGLDPGPRRIAAHPEVERTALLHELREVLVRLEVERDGVVAVDPATVDAVRAGRQLVSQ